MIKIFKIYFVFFIFFFSINFGEAWGKTASTQNKNIDSLLTLLKKDKPDTNKVKHFSKLCMDYESVGLYDTVMRYANLELQLAQQLNLKKEIFSSYNNLGIVYRNQGNYPKAIDYYFKELKIAEEINNKNFIATALGNIGIVYGSQGDYPKALDYSLKALKMDEGLGNKNAIARHLGNIGGIYSQQKNYINALECYFKALKMSEDLKDRRGEARHLSNIGEVYHLLKDDPKAIEYYSKSLKIAEEIGNKSSIAINLGAIGSLYSTTKKYAEAEKYLQRALAVSESMGALNLEMDQQIFLTELYEKMGKPAKALEYYKKAMAVKDSVFNLEKDKQITRKEMNYVFDKKEAIAKAENDKQQAIAEEKNRKQKIITWSVACGLLLVIVFAGFVFRSLRLTRKQKGIIEVKNKDITDSIRYAKQIQDALLREEEHISMHLPEHFILFMPKDIVSGDFYWGAEKQGYWYFAVVDCTGHGVPGAIMSMLGISFLNDIVFSEGLHSPAEILNRLRDKVVKELRQTGEDGGSKDGMDISLCRLELRSPNGEGQGMKLQWAGANNSLNLIQNGQLGIVKADKQPIGYHLKSHPFTNHEIQLQKGDSIYLYSDGYADQFGGSKGKKYKYKQLDDLIIKQKHIPMKEQKVLLKKHFLEWKGALEQVDDVCVFGVRV